MDIFTSIGFTEAGDVVNIYTGPSRTEALAETEKVAPALRLKRVEHHRLGQADTFHNYRPWPETENEASPDLQADADEKAKLAAEAVKAAEEAEAEAKAGAEDTALSRQAKAGRTKTAQAARAKADKAQAVADAAAKALEAATE